MRATEAKVEVDPETGVPIDPPSPAPIRPTEWPLRGSFSPWVRPATVLASAFGLELYSEKIGGPAVFTLDPLSVALAPDPVSVLLLVLAPFISGLLIGRRTARFCAADTVRRRLLIGLLAGIFAAVLTFTTSIALAARSLPSWHPDWRQYFVDLRAAGLMPKFDPLTAANVWSLAAAGGVLLVASLGATYWQSRPSS